jgi:hypothetical protein
MMLTRVKVADQLLILFLVRGAHVDDDEYRNASDSKGRCE